MDVYAYIGESILNFLAHFKHPPPPLPSSAGASRPLRQIACAICAPMSHLDISTRGDHGARSPGTACADGGLVAERGLVVSRNPANTSEGKQVCDRSLPDCHGR